MLKQLRKLFGLSKTGGRGQPRRGGLVKRSRWDSAATNRLTGGKWTKATGQPINRDLGDDRDKLRFRSAWEIANNPYCEGLINTYLDDVVGPRGPQLQVISNDADFNKAFEEEIWKPFFADPDVNHTLSGPEYLRLSLRGCFPDGEFITQLVHDRELAETNPLFSERLLPIASYRLRTDPKNAGNGEWTHGVRRDRTGRPLEYALEDVRENEFVYRRHYDTTNVDADFIIHGFDVIEPGQARGVPWFACNLQTIADLRDYTESVLEAAANIAKLSAVMKQTHPDIEDIDEVNEEMELEKGMMITLPTGYEMQQLKPEQPSATYESFVNEKLRELGRPVGMPLMILKLDASGHNYSSARFDGQNYQRAIAYRQAWMDRIILNRLASRLLKHARLLAQAGKLTRRLNRIFAEPPTNVKFTWSWPVRPHVDPFKEGKGEEVGLANGTVSSQQAIAARGGDLETVIEQNKEAIRMYEAAGVPLPAHLREEASGGGQGHNPDGTFASTNTPPDTDEDEEKDEDDREFDRMCADHDATKAVRNGSVN